MELTGKIKWAALVILLTLLGLLSVQGYLIALMLENEGERLDDIVDVTLLDIHHNVEDDKQLSGTLIYILKTREAGLEPHLDSVRKAVSELTFRIDSISKENGIDLQFDFVLFATRNNRLMLTSGKNESLNKNYTTNSIKAGWRIREALGEGQYRFGLYYYNAYLLLLKRLWFMLALTLFLFVALIAGVVYSLKNWKKQRDLTLLKNDLVNNLTHELNTPLFSTSLLLKLLRQRVNGHFNGSELLDMLESENHRLRQRVDKVLDIAHIEGGHLKLKKDKTDMHELIDRVVNPFRLRVTGLGGSITVNKIARNVHVIGDAVHLENVLYNLLENALKYSDGPPEVCVESFNEHNKLIISVRDNGMGISESERDLVFEKFYRSKEQGPVTSPGLGLGLNYVRMIMEMHNGSIKIQPNANKGTIVNLYFTCI